MNLIWKIGRNLLGFIAAVLLATLGVANRHDVMLILDPFKPQDPVISINAPFYVFLFGTLFVGILLGGFASWLTQGKWRKTARKRTHEAYRWKQEADRLNRERGETRPALPSNTSNR